MAAGLFANLAALERQGPDRPAAVVSNFLFFWFPNEASVFAIGGVLFFVLRAIQRQGTNVQPALVRYGTPFALLSIVAFAALAYTPLGHFIGDRPFVPAGQLVCLPLAGLILALSANRGLLVSKPVALMGQVSFSAYLLHYAILQTYGAFPEVTHTRAQGASAVAAYVIGCYRPRGGLAAHLRCVMVQLPADREANDRRRAGRRRPRRLGTRRALAVSHVAAAAASHWPGSPLPAPLQAHAADASHLTPRTRHRRDRAAGRTLASRSGPPGSGGARAP